MRNQLPEEINRHQVMDIIMAGYRSVTARPFLIAPGNYEFIEHTSMRIHDGELESYQAWATVIMLPYVIRYVDCEGVIRDWHGHAAICVSQCLDCAVHGVEKGLHLCEKCKVLDVDMEAAVV